jgi:uncharacterized protein
MKSRSLLLWIILLIVIASSAVAQETHHIKRYVKVPAGYIMVLRQGDDIIKELEAFAINEHVPAASFTGMGFVNIVFGFFDANAKKFNPKEFRNVELASMNGTIAWQKGKPSIHTHGVVAGKDFQAYGGHILSGTVGTGSLEIMVIIHDKSLERVFEEPLGANVLRLEEEN